MLRAAWRPSEILDSKADPIHTRKIRRQSFGAAGDLQQVALQSRNFQRALLPILPRRASLGTTD